MSAINATNIPAKVFKKAQIRKLELDMSWNGYILFLIERDLKEKPELKKNKGGENVPEKS